MEIRYKRDLNSNYMILKDEYTGREGYEVRMITENRIHGFLPCVIQRHEGQTEYYYEITGRQSMELLYERRKLKSDQLRSLLKELLRVFESAKEYLLDPNHFILSPDSMYLDVRSEKLYLCYHPGFEKEIRDTFLNLTEYLLGKLDKSDAEGIALGYELFQSAQEPNFSLLEYLQKHAGTEKEKEEAKPLILPVPAVTVKEEILEKTGSWKNFFRKKTKEGSLEDYVAEADQIKSGAELFIREEEDVPETACLQKTSRERLFLRSVSREYPDLQMKGDSFLIGKKKDSVDGCVPAATISRIHARITWDGMVYYVEDLNSTNGTWVDQVQLDPYELYPLKDGMYLTFASVEYEVEL